MRRCHRNSTALKVIALALLLGFSVACDVEADGEEGNFTFKYVDSEGTTAQDLAVGSKVKFEVVDAESDDPINLAEVYSEAADVIEIIEQRDTGFTVEAVDAGTARITAEASESGDDGEALTDSAQFRAAEASVARFESVCSSDIFFTDGYASAKLNLEDDGENRLTGFGYYPVSIEPEGGGVIDARYERLGFVQIETGSDAGDYEFSSDLSSHTLDFELVDAADVETMELSNFEDGDSLSPIDEGESKHVAPFSLMIGSDAICGPPGGNLEITSETPNICSARYGRIFENIQGLLDLNMVVVEGLETGQCEVSISVPDAGLNAGFDIEVR